MQYKQIYLIVITAIGMQSAALWCMEGNERTLVSISQEQHPDKKTDMPALVPDYEQEHTAIVLSKAQSSAPRNIPSLSTLCVKKLVPQSVPSLVLCCLKPACLAYLEHKSEEEQARGDSDNAIDIFHDRQKSRAWFSVYTQIVEHLGKPYEFKATGNVLQARWQNSYHKYSSMYGSLGSPTVNLDYVLKNNHCGWNNEDDFLHYFDEMVCKCYRRSNLKEVCDDAIYHQAPQAVYSKLAALGLKVCKARYLTSAIISNNIDHTKYLLKNGLLPADVKNIYRPMPYGALHYLVQWPLSFNPYPIIQVLIEHRADIHQKNAGGLTPADVAWLNDKNDIADFLDEYEDATNPKMHALIPARFCGIVIPEGISAYKQRYIRRLNALEKKATRDIKFVQVT